MRKILATKTTKKEHTVFTVVLFLISFNLIAQTSGNPVPTWRPVFSNTESIVPFYPYSVDDSTIIFGGMRQGEFEVYLTRDTMKTFEVTYSLWNTNTSLAYLEHFNYVGNGHIWAVLGGLLSHKTMIKRNKNLGYGEWDTIWFPSKELVEQYDLRINQFRMYDTAFGGLMFMASLPDDAPANYDWTNVLAITDDAWQTHRIIRVDSIFNKRISAERTSQNLHFFSKEHFTFFNTHGIYPGETQSTAEIFTTKDGGETWERYDIRQLFPNEDRYKRLYISEMIWTNKNTGFLLGYYYHPVNHPVGGNLPDAEWNFVLRTINGGNSWQIVRLIDSLDVVRFPNGANSISAHHIGVNATAHNIILTGIGGNIQRQRFSEGQTIWEFQTAKDPANTFGMGTGSFWHGDKPYLLFGIGEHRIWAEVEILLGNVSKPTVIDIDTTKATFNANMLSHGGASFGDFEVGFVYSTSPNPIYDAEDVSKIIGTVVNWISYGFTATVDDLASDTEYFMKAYIKNSAGIAYSNEVSFTTDKKVSVLEQIITNLLVAPNPTDASTTVSVDLETAGNLTVTLNNMLGQELFEIHNGFTSAGEFTKTFSLKELPIGVYYLKIVHNGNVRVEKVIRQ